MTASGFNCDVLVIGAGAAGIRAAIAATDSGCGVIIANKKKLCESGSSFYKGTPGWGLCAAVHKNDSPQNHLDEIMELACGTVDENLARRLTSDVGDRICDLERYGIGFKKNPDGSYLSVKPCFAKTERSVSVRGMDDIKSVFKSQVESRGINVLEECSILGLFISDSQCCGAYGIDENSNLIQIYAKSTIISTGGAISLFGDNYSIGDLTGDGYSMALDAGAALTNLEFIQFIPATSLPQKGRPFEQRALRYLDYDKSSEAINKLSDEASESPRKVLKDRATHGPFSTKDCGQYFDQTLLEGSDEYKLFFRREMLVSDNWVARNFAERMADYGIDIFGEGICLTLFAQAFNGGILIDENAATSVRGLFACGEASGGMHGADRMGGCAMASTQVFGKIAGDSAAKNAKSASCLYLADARAELLKLIGYAPAQCFDLSVLKYDIKQTVSYACSCVRSRQKCLQALASLESGLHKSLSTAAYAMHAQDNSMLKDVIGCYHMINSGKAVIMMIMNRAQSVGPHSRADSKGHKATHHMHLIQKKDGKMAVNSL
jgi:L-aspartate oxidase